MVEQLADALDALAATDVATLDDVGLREQLLDLLIAGNRVQAELVRRVDVFERRGLHEGYGFRTTRAWLMAFGRVGAGFAGRLVKAARLLRRLPKLAVAARSGEVTSEHVQQVVQLAERVGADEIESVEAVLADAARVLDPARFQLVCQRVVAHIDPDGGEDPAKAYEKRGITLAPSAGMVWLRGQLDPEGGAALAAALDALMTPPSDTDERSGPQRRADALVDLARLGLSGDKLPTAGGHRPQVGVLLYPQALSPETLAALAQVHKDEAAGERFRALLRTRAEEPAADWTRPGVSLDRAEQAAAGVGRVSREVRGGSSAAGATAVAETLAGESSEATEDGPPRKPGSMWSARGWADPPWLSWVGAVSPVVAQRIACDADIWRIILDPRTGMPLDVGRGYRLVPHWIRKALVARDRGCRWPGCHAPPEWCDGHHLKPWAEQGETTADGCLLLCRHHHVLVHEGGWGIRLDPNTGDVTVTRPGGLRYELNGGRTTSWNGPASQIE